MLRSPHSDVGCGNSQQDLIEHFGAQRLDNGVPNKVSCPDVGTCGSTVNLRANLFEVKFPKDIVMFDYVISINPYVPTTKVDLVILSNCLLSRGNFLHTSRELHMMAPSASSQSEAYLQQLGWRMEESMSLPSMNQNPSLRTGKTPTSLWDHLSP